MADEASYVRQVSLHAAAVLRVATALVGHDDAEDAAQEALTRAWRAWGTLRDTNAARSWLLRITVNVCREWLRGSDFEEAKASNPDDGTARSGEAGDS